MNIANINGLLSLLGQPTMPISTTAAPTQIDGAVAGDFTQLLQSLLSNNQIDASQLAALQTANSDTLPAWMATLVDMMAPNATSADALLAQAGLTDPKKGQSNADISLTQIMAALQPVVNQSGTVISPTGGQPTAATTDAGASLSGQDAAQANLNLAMNMALQSTRTPNTAQPSTQGQATIATTQAAANTAQAATTTTQTSPFAAVLQQSATPGATNATTTPATDGLTQTATNATASSTTAPNVQTTTGVNVNAAGSNVAATQSQGQVNITGLNNAASAQTGSSTQATVQTATGQVASQSSQTQFQVDTSAQNNAATVQTTSQTAEPSTTGQVAQPMVQTQPSAQPQAAPVVWQPVETPEMQAKPVVDQLGDTIKLLNRNGGTEVRMQLYPKELGQVLVQMHMVDEHMTVRMMTESTQARALIQDNINQLRNTFNAQGFNINSINVDVGSDASSFHAQQQTAQMAGGSTTSSLGNPTTLENDQQDVRGRTPKTTHLGGIDYHA